MSLVTDMSDIDRERCRELLSKLSEIRRGPQGADDPEYAYWKGYLRSYCDQNAIPSEAIARIWEDVAR